MLFPLMALQPAVLTGPNQDPSSLPNPASPLSDAWTGTPPTATRPSRKQRRSRNPEALVSNRALQQETPEAHMDNQVQPSPSGSRWIQLICGIICMAMIANLQYGWTLFVDPIDAKGLSPNNRVSLWAVVA
jgi:hypothetical protein